MGFVLVVIVYVIGRKLFGKCLADLLRGRGVCWRNDFLSLSMNINDLVC